MDERRDNVKSPVYEGKEGRLINCMRRAQDGEALTLAFLGGSITQGCLATKPELCYAYRTYDWWVKSFPKGRFTYVNAGIGGTTSHLGVGRVEEDVLSHHPDFVIVEFSVNDPDEDPHFQETYESLVRRILSAPEKPAVLLAHNVRYDDGGNAEKIHRPVGVHYGLPGVSMIPGIYDRVAKGEIEVRSITQDDLHPNDLGHELVAKTITDYLETVRNKVKEGSREEDDPYLPLPAPLTANTYENALRRRNDVLIPVVNHGFTADDAIQSCVADCFKRGWQGRKKGDKISFEVTCGNLAVQYRKTVRKPAPIARLTVDGDRENSILLDANFQETWGDCLYLENVFEHGRCEKHLVEIEIVEAHEEDAESFYLVSLITA